ncbi:5-formyltetrahydrofolate cyclo-ligase [Candidatus Magnetominusculus xianensis]|uniref:5-formyltetrahydrofolate cyclo-ligase n=1 Tax=Candidatus Magnetominusculus xianensis TaxID=1748249 RepID=A0ABR5SDS1_9BACT|nr:5-formyltetrahydrofolate cyclo-ligase [Candidatus Magnetominusculus xianensis]KWT83484.1 5-formyltetrahydrofolate cyclo-ligase [Candidatus Magnetominusculus xianensis]MBF0404124.1 5-formyltetrahydrofolate cyclo-ligase [Nitrospirota bacterium]
MIAALNDHKAALRREALRLRDSIDPKTKKTKDSEIHKNLFQTREFTKAKSVMFFASIRSEPNTLDMIAAALTLNKIIVLPRVNLKERSLEPYIITNLFELVPGYMNIPEPHPELAAKCSAEDIDVIVMPGLAFDKSGGRVGYGGGYYDRFISGIKGQRPVLAAVAYDEQVMESVPVMSYDQRIDMIVTESGVFRVSAA